MFLHGLSDDPATTAAAGASSSLDQAVGTFLAATPQPSASDVASFLKTFDPGDPQTAAAQALIAQGVDIDTVSHALHFVSSTGGDGGMSYLTGALTLAAAGAGAYHGFRRNQSVGWAVGWFAMGLIFPIFTSALALGEGFGKRKGA